MNVFEILAFFCLVFISLFFLSVFLSVIFFTDFQTLISSFFSEEVKFATSLTFLTATISTIISLVVGIPAAYVLSRRNFPGKSVVEALLDVPFALPPISLGMTLLIFFTHTPIGTYINESVVRFVFEVPGLILAQFTVISVLTIKLVKAVFDGVDVRYERIARTLGYSELESFTYVTLPLAKKGILSAALLSWARAVGEFGASVTLAGATRFKTETLSIALFLNLATGEIEKAVALICVFLILNSAILTATRRLLYRGFTP